jgi:anti-sigma-K factor RskA
MFTDLRADFATLQPPPHIEAALLAEMDMRVARLRFALQSRSLPKRSPAWRFSLAFGAIAAILVAAIALRPHAVPVVPGVPLPVAVVEPVTDPLRASVTAPGLPGQRRIRRPPVEPQPQAAVEAEAPFVELPWIVPLSPGESASVVRMNLAVSALISAGLSIDADPTGSAAADVVVGMDGRAHAVRLVSVSDTLNANRRMQ